MLKINRTERYLSPVLNTFPKTFVAEFNKAIHLLEGFYLYDVDYYKAKRWKEPKPFLFLKYKKDKDLKWFLQHARGSKWYQDDYPLDLSSKIGVLLKVPPDFHPAYDHFIKGSYSKMYTEAEQRKVGINPIRNGNVNMTWAVMNKDMVALDYYKEVIRVVYATNHTANNPEEYDIPPTINLEVLNWEKDIDYVKDYLKVRNYKPE